MLDAAVSTAPLLPIVGIQRITTTAAVSSCVAVDELLLTEKNPFDRMSKKNGI